MFECVASQPIFNIKKEIFGYELLYRAGKDSTEYDGIDGSSATKDVLVTAFSDIGIEAITGGRKAFVNFTSDLVLDEVPHMLSNDILIVELLENVHPTEAILAACRKLKRRGYLIALDDFSYSEEIEPLIGVADIIKIDFMKCGVEDIKKNVYKINNNRRKILLAEKIETYEDLEFARELGFNLFQGFFFCKPIIANAKCAEALQVSKLQLIKYIADPEVSFFDLANVIKRDLVLSYRLLKIVNSAYYGLKYTVTGILHALLILGLNEIKKWISLIVLNQIKTTKPSELIRAALVRGIFMEKLAIFQKRRKSRDEYFLVGLFSLAEAIMDTPIDAILSETHLSDEITRPLITGEGEKADLLKIIYHIERAEWDEAEEIAGKCGVDQAKTNQFYIEAMIDANKLLS
ncbi:EAL and modified HD-GYP domain-containing signal transduction protein [Sporobacter termitidis DSM 10068]|uniref:EAL and modified HD-GYP domain-containing signal transduction protein n=1 Tax=Sporobacter termitidis DSM 10068 TaxID=1123282 RepID=A0A1M5W7X8_9FIRM|nr:HDOD domain-containing protein [Sporobacter termitidis]SHH83587.1 EAL and modified HD-GYP domain-containing signal transduction protein [Sporobacter termitidis DSM 10068]